MKCHSGLDPESITIRKTIISLRNWIPHQVRDDKNVVFHCMAEFARQFGIDWRLLISQAVNFALVLVVLRMFVYKPVAAILRERRQRVQQGIAKAQEADLRLQQAQEMARGRLQEAEAEAMSLLRDTETKAKEREMVLLESSRRKGEVLMQEARRTIDAEQEKIRAELEREARMLVRTAVARVVEMDPEHIGDSLIEKALTGVTKHA